MRLNMNCRKAEKYLAAYVDGELRKWRRRRAFTKHLKKCALCQEKVAIQKHIKNLLRTKLRPIEAPDDLETKIHRALESECIRACASSGDADCDSISC
jgi:anti-sigma factor (TIGR02949 family)